MLVERHVAREMSELRGDEIYACPSGVVVNGQHSVVRLALTLTAARMARDDIKKNENLWRSFSATVNSLREIDKLNSDAASVPLATEDVTKIIEIIEAHARCGQALYVPFLEHVRKVGLDFQ